MKFKIDEQIFKKFPNFMYGVEVCKGVNNVGTDEELLQKIKSAEESNRKEFVKEGLGSVPYFKEWRKAYSSFGVDPTKFKCSSEAIARRVIKGDSIPHINKLVDSYNYISLKYHTPCGGEDIDKMKGDIILKYSEGSEKYTQLGSKEETKVSKGEVVYVSGDEVICAKWNWRESEKTKITKDTRNAFVIAEALPPLTFDVVKEASEELASSISTACGIFPEVHYVTEQNHSCEIY